MIKNNFEPPLAGAGVQFIAVETVKKVVERRYMGRKIVTKETQEGCLKVNCPAGAREGGLGHSLLRIRS